jgi:hypothetical protein
VQKIQVNDFAGQLIQMDQPDLVCPSQLIDQKKAESLSVLHRQLMFLSRNYFLSIKY